MTKIHKKVLSLTSVIALTLSSVTPVFASTASITGNGYMSDNDIEVETSSNTVVKQSNVADVTNSVSTVSKTGGNSASYNTGGDSVVFTGNAGSWVTVANTLNTNSASVACCDEEGFDVTIDGNGANSDNEFEFENGEGKPRFDLKNQSDITVLQENLARVDNLIESDAKTGWNDANYNTGGSSVVMTGSAESHAGVSTVANSNWAQIGGSAGLASSGLSAVISGNGYKSDNEIEVELRKSTGVFQNNLAEVLNDVEADSSTGKNDANYNTGGMSLVETGNAGSAVAVENNLNFNWADVSCCAMFDTDLSVMKNGAYSDNDIELDLHNDRSVTQTNAAHVANLVEGDASTGKNDANYNTGGDVKVMTGYAESLVGVMNELNFNYANIDCCDFGLAADIAKNGASSDSEIELDQHNNRTTWQENLAKLDNLIGGEHSGAFTGYNDADYNTGDPDGDPAVMTGSAFSMTTVGNSLNVNSDNVAISVPGFNWEFQFAWNWSHLFGWW